MTGPATSIISIRAGSRTRIRSGMNCARSARLRHQRFRGVFFPSRYEDVPRSRTTPKFLLAPHHRARDTAAAHPGAADHLGPARAPAREEPAAAGVHAGRHQRYEQHKRGICGKLIERSTARAGAMRRSTTRRNSGACHRRDAGPAGKRVTAFGMDPRDPGARHHPARLR